MLLRVPISSSGPQRPQFFSRSAAASMSLRVSFERASFIRASPFSRAFLSNLLGSVSVYTGPHSLAARTRSRAEEVRFDEHFRPSRVLYKDEKSEPASIII